MVERSGEPDWDNYERTTSAVSVFVGASDGEDGLHLTVTDVYVGLHESSGGKGLRTVRYELKAHGEFHGCPTVPVTPLQMVEIGEAFVRAGLKALSEQEGRAR